MKEISMLEQSGSNSTEVRLTKGSVGKYYRTGGGSEDSVVYITGVSPIDKGYQIFTAVNMDNESFTYYNDGECTGSTNMRLEEEYTPTRTLEEIAGDLDRVLGNLSVVVETAIKQGHTHHLKSMRAETFEAIRKEYKEYKEAEGLEL